jgi:hypothetical protein
MASDPMRHLAPRLIVAQTTRSVHNMLSRTLLATSLPKGSVPTATIGHLTLRW